MNCFVKNNSMRTVQLYVWLLVLLSHCTNAQKPEIFQTNEGAIRGYDPVAYFTDGKPQKGEKQHSFTYKGATWYFASEANLNLFSASPEKYAPQFGGYCSYAVSQNYTYETDPSAFTIVEGKLYLNYNQKTMDHWRSKQQEYINSANSNWPGVLKK
jgi:YHS domain-containing protein